MTKTFSSVADLAINGAHPMFPQPIHVGRPNIGNRDTFRLLTEELLDRHWLSNDGPLLRRFEAEVCSLLAVKHCIAMCNGTVALEIATRALDLHGEVIVPSYTFIATAHALQWQEITPVFADIDPATHNIDPKAVRKMITPQTSGILAVHLWGRPAAVKELEEIARVHGIKIMYDASHAFDCSLGGVPIGNFGECEVFSFHATKFFNTFEGGAVVTNNDELADKMRLMRNFGFAGYDNVIYPGTNGKMTEIAAAMGLTNLQALNDFVDTNRRNYELYAEELQNIPGISLLQYDRNERNNFQYVVIAVGRDYAVGRDLLIQILHAENVLARKYFWPGCHNMAPYQALYPHAGLVLPETIHAASEVAVLPTGTGVDAADILRIAEILRVLPTLYSPQRN